MRLFERTPLEQVKSALDRKYPDSRFIFNLIEKRGDKLLKISYDKHISADHILITLKDFTDKFVIILNEIEIPAIQFNV